MNAYSINDYDFYADYEFQQYFRSQRPDGFVPRYKYLKILNACQKEWINRLNKLEEENKEE